MCSVSAVSDYYTRTYPDRFGVSPFQQPVLPMSPITVPPPFADAETKDMMRQVIRMLDKIDKKLGDVECMDDAKKQFLKALDIDPASIGG